MSIAKIAFYLINTGANIFVYYRLYIGFYMPLIFRLSLLTMINFHLCIFISTIGLLTALFGCKPQIAFLDGIYQFTACVGLNVVSLYWVLVCYDHKLVYGDYPHPGALIDYWIHLGIFLFLMFDLIFIARKKYNSTATSVLIAFLVAYAIYLQILSQVHGILIYPISKGEHSVLYAGLCFYGILCIITFLRIFKTMTVKNKLD